MFTVDKDGLRICADIPRTCVLSLRGRLTAATEADEACPVTVLSHLLEDLLEAQIDHYEIDLTGLREIDIFGMSLLRSLQARASCRLRLLSTGTLVEPLLAIELITKFDWHVVDRAA